MLNPALEELAFRQTNDFLSRLPLPVFTTSEIAALRRLSALMKTEFGLTTPDERRDLLAPLVDLSFRLVTHYRDVIFSREGAVRFFCTVFDLKAAEGAEKLAEGATLLDEIIAAIPADRIVGPREVPHGASEA